MNLLQNAVVSSIKAPKPKDASKKRPAVDVGAAVAKNKRTLKKNSVTSHSTLELVAVAQEIVTLQMVEPCPDVPAVEEHIEQPAAEEGISADQPVEVGDVAAEIDASAVRDNQLIQIRRASGLILLMKNSLLKAVESVIEVEEATTDKDFLVVDDPDTVINQVLQQLDSISADKDDKSGTGAETWFDRALDEILRKDEGAETMDVDTAGGDQQVQCSEEEPVVQKTNDDLLDDDEQKLLEDILLTIPVDIPLPSASMEITKIVVGKEIKIPEEVQEVNAKVDIMASRLNDVQQNVEATKEALSHQLLEFQSQAQANQNILHAQLSELVNYINRGSADKKGEGSSRGPQKPPNVQIRDSGTCDGSAVRTPDFAQRVEMTQRRIVESVLDADRNSESLERQAAAERDRERRRREARMLKRRRKF
ncbi:hypothetical protein F511_41074 [Dorcoceras hygrometricum]|uniref:Uncharacterized protein n=1 Tax=Dorcoceras hygrometricum TaxID=472368 RepID=A0A2Z7C049_9LAMI|nr:hypothetical protein F511_41074 [Dorcoceras hygrometricum]